MFVSEQKEPCNAIMLKSCTRIDSLLYRKEDSRWSPITAENQSPIWFEKMKTFGVNRS